MAISLREKRLIAVAGLLLIVLIVYLLMPGDPPPAPAPAPVRTQAAAPPPPPPPPPDVSGLRLHGLLASGAIVGLADGSQRLVLVGREALPGLMLRRIEQAHAIFASSAGEVRLGFDGAAQAQAQAQAQAAPAPAAAAARDETLPYRLGLAPQRAGGRVMGFRVRPGASLPALERAGIRPGDNILSVNGSRLDEERMLELPWQIANSTQTLFEIERGGRRLRMTLQRR